MHLLNIYHLNLIYELIYVLKKHLYVEITHHLSYPIKYCFSKKNKKNPDFFFENPDFLKHSGFSSGQCKEKKLDRIKSDTFLYKKTQQ